MSYRRPIRPTQGAENVRYWLDWLEDDDRLMPLVGTTEPTCRDCLGAVGLRDDGQPWDTCHPCGMVHRLRFYLAGVVPITYSVARGFESLIYYFKDERRDWLRYPLGCLLYNFLFRHMSHIERTFGTMDIVTVVPSHPEVRGGWDHVKELVTAVEGWDAQLPWNLELLRRTRAERDGRVVDATLYEPTRPVEGLRVLLVDDTFTTGATICSAAAALTRAGAESVVALPLGRQLNPSFGPARLIVEEQREKPFNFNACVLE